MKLMCGNCGKTDHRYVSCPYIDMQFPLIKKEYADLKEKARKWDEFEKRMEKLGMTPKLKLKIEQAWVDGFKDVNQNQKLRELIEEKIEDFASRKLPHVVIHELQKLLEESKK